MKIIVRYLCKEFFMFFFISLITFLIIYMVVEFFGKIDNFVEANVPLNVAFSYLIYQIPLSIQQLIPVSVLISVMLMLGIMNKHNEILAMKNCGLNLFNLSYPIIAMSILTGIGSFFLSESIVPITSSMANNIWNIQVEKRSPRGAYKLSQLWYRGKGSIYQIRTYDSRKNIIEGFSIFLFDKDFTLTKRIDARKATWINDRWYLNDGLIQEIEPDGSRKSIRFTDHSLQLPEGPKSLETTMKAPEEMSFWELRGYAKKISEEGYDSTRFQVDLHIKIAFPFICPVLTLVGIPLALRRKRGGIPLSITFGIGISFLYLLTFGLSRSLAISGVLPPILGAWIANLLFSLFGVYLMLVEEG
ncbi:MAG: LPS export ABC transporter permease LptG [Deltaproteobacteria bacterium]|jgi:lipopolysaccharide export system permease protein|nr:MAG: LPS export ABC transporter permease LptG [Deltaproteobacteria bacterium]